MQEENGPICFRCFVAGQVQGVFFRAFAREQALRLGLSGYARNLPDGRVEVLACGDAKPLAQFRDRLREGPSQANVTGLACEPTAYQALTGFSIQ